MEQLNGQVSDGDNQVEEEGNKAAGAGEEIGAKDSIEILATTDHLSVAGSSQSKKDSTGQNEEGEAERGAVAEPSGMDGVKLRQRRKRELMNIKRAEVKKRLKKAPVHRNGGFKSKAWPTGNSNSAKSKSSNAIRPDTDFYGVKKLVEGRWRGKFWEYLLRWDGNYPDTWEPHHNLTKDLLRNFWRKNMPKLEGGHKTAESGAQRTVLAIPTIPRNIPAFMVDKRGARDGFDHGFQLVEVEAEFQLAGEQCVLVHFRDKQLWSF